MQPFYSKDKRVIVPREHIADFTGLNNSSKSKVLLYLLHEKGKYFTARQLHEETGVSYDYLRGRLSFWYNIRYLDRAPIISVKGKLAWGYRIDDRGEHFVKDRIPQEKREEYLSDINLWRVINSQESGK